MTLSLQLLGELRQEDHSSRPVGLQNEFRASLGNLSRPCLKTLKKYGLGCMQLADWCLACMSPCVLPLAPDKGRNEMELTCDLASRKQRCED